MRLTRACVRWWLRAHRRPRARPRHVSHARARPRAPAQARARAREASDCAARASGVRRVASCRVRGLARLRCACAYISRQSRAPLSVTSHEAVEEASHTCRSWASSAVLRHAQKPNKTMTKTIKTIRFKDENAHPPPLKSLVSVGVVSVHAPQRYGK